MIPEIHPVQRIGQGSLYVMPMPDSGNLQAAVDHFSSIKITAVVSHLEKSEELKLGLSREQALLQTAGIEFVTYPIKDMHLPDKAAYTLFIDSLYRRLEKGDNLAVHCRAGIGRTGMTSSCLLIRAGFESRDAIEAVASARGVSIPDTQEQIDFICDFSSIPRVVRNE